MLRLLVFLPFLFACSQVKNEEFVRHHNNFYYEMSENERVISSCLIEERNYCESRDQECRTRLNKCFSKNGAARSIASSVSAEYLAQYDWLFLNPKKLQALWKNLKLMKKVYKNIRKNFYKKTLDSLHGRGVGFTANGFLWGVHGSFAAEAVIHDRELALFCAPGVGVITDQGAQVGVTGIRTYSCQKNADYRGQFLNFSAGVSTEAFLIPGALDAAYSFGIDLTSFLKTLKKEKSFSIPLLMEEVVLFQALQLLKLSPSEKKLLLSLPFILFGELTENLNPVNILFKNNIESLGSKLKRLLKSKYLLRELEFHKLKNLKTFIKAVDSGLSGCDAVSGTLSLAATALPVNVGVGVSYFSQLMKLNLDSFEKIRDLAPLAIINPIFMAKETIEALVSFAQVTSGLQNRVVGACFVPAVQEIHQNYQQTMDLFRK